MINKDYLREEIRRFEYDFFLNTDIIREDLIANSLAFVKVLPDNVFTPDFGATDHGTTFFSWDSWDYDAYIEIGAQHFHYLVTYKDHEPLPPHDDFPTIRRYKVKETHTVEVGHGENPEFDEAINIITELFC